MDNEQIKIRKDRMGDIRNEINALNEMKKKYGQLAGMFQAMIDSLFYQYTSLSGEIDAINIEILGTQNGLLISQQELNDLMVEYYQIVVDIDEAQIGLLESEMKYATPEDKLKYQQQINDFIKDEIKQLGDELGITDDINDQLKLKTEIQDLQNTLMEQETEEMKKQYDYLTKFLDLQNLSDLRDLQKMNENLGYQGLGLMAQMADQGVSQAAMAAAGVDRSLKVANLNVNNYGTGVDSVAANLMYAVNRMWLVR
jgi:chromosome segregation ATPase